MKGKPVNCHRLQEQILSLILIVLLTVSSSTSALNSLVCRIWNTPNFLLIVQQYLSAYGISLSLHFAFEFLFEFIFSFIFCLILLTSSLAGRYLALRIRSCRIQIGCQLCSDNLKKKKLNPWPHLCPLFQILPNWLRNLLQLSHMHVNFKICI